VETAVDEQKLAEVNELELHVNLWLSITPSTVN